MLITHLVAARADLLTPTDRRLVAALQAAPAEASFWSAAALTEPLGLHQSSATRLAQRLGFEGYPQLRDALRQDYLAGDGPSQRLRGRLEQHPDDDVLRSFVADELAVLAELPRHVDQSELDALADRVLTAPRVFLYGQGNATVLVDLLERRLGRFGLPTTLLTGSRRDIAERAVALGPGDLVVAVAFRRLPTALGVLLDVAHEAGAHTALLTDTLLSVSPRPDTLVAAPRGSGDAFLSLTVPMALVNALVLTIARRAPDDALRPLDRLGRLIERLDC